MVVVWNSLASGSPEWAAGLVAINSLLQLALYSPYAYLFTAVIVPHTGGSAASGSVSFLLILQSVAIYLGIPFFLGVSCWALLPRLKGARWYTQRFLPTIAPLTLMALLFTVVVMFILQGHRIGTTPVLVLRIIAPLVLFFLLMFFGALACAASLRLPFTPSVTVAFTAASNNFELSIAVCVALFGLGSDEVLAAVVGPLVEVPIMMSFVHVLNWLRPRWPGGEMAPTVVDT